MKQALIALTLGLFLVAGQVVAQESAAKKEKQDECQGACPIATAMEKLPKMIYTVGDTELCCGESAAQLAKEKNLPVKYVVGKQKFEDEGEAYVSLVETTEEFVNNFAKVSKCEASGTISIAGEACDCPVAAAEKETMIKTAMDQVQMQYQVGEETCNCPVTAKAKAKKADAEVTYVVGEQKTSCEYSARLNLAHAKYKAAVAALQSPKEETVDTKIN